MSGNMARQVDLVVLSDLHLGTPACRADLLLAYLHSVLPDELVLNGDVVDLRELSPGSWTASHTAVVERVLALAAGGTQVHYLTGNHDRALRWLPLVTAGAIQLGERLERQLGGRRTWILHGDAVEHTVPIARWRRRVGCIAYNVLGAIERCLHPLRWLGWTPPLRRLAKRAPGVVAHIQRYEDACAQHAAEHGFDAIVTGHIHHPNQRRVDCGGRAVDYLNSGDWVESCTALEHHAGTWSLVRAHPGRAEPEPVAALGSAAG